jgi:hypothetical protein
MDGQPQVPRFQEIENPDRVISPDATAKSPMSKKLNDFEFFESIIEKGRRNP